VRAQSRRRTGDPAGPHRVRRLAVAVVLIGLLDLVVWPTAAAAATPDPGTHVEYHPPSDAAIVDHFRPPPHLWDAGNRGIDYGTEPGAAVAAAADGRVVFAGQVGGALHVTVEHTDGLRTSYSFLDTITVRAGDRVRGGDVIGIAGGPFHFGVRTPDGAYLDPEAVLAGTVRPRVRLVPGTDNGLEALTAHERQTLLDTLLDDGAAAVHAIASWSSSTASLVEHYAIELTPPVHILRGIEAVDRWYRQRDTCTDASVAVPPHSSRRIVVLVSGLGTASTGNSAWEVDTATLGYASRDVVRFSYAGGRAPGPAAGGQSSATAVGLTGAGPGLDAVPVREFSSLDSQQSIPESADRLAALLRSVAAAEPDVPIDVVAHSQGGVVARLGIERAGAAGRLSGTTGGAGALARVRASGMAGELDDRLPAMGDLSEISPVIAELHDRPVPDGVRFVTLGGSGDLVVPGTASGDPAAGAGVILPTPVGTAAHGSLPSDPRATREIGLAVAGLGPSCQGLGEVLGSFFTAEGVRYGEEAGGATAAVAAGVLPFLPGE
jgi:hypothetical protein